MTKRRGIGFYLDNKFVITKNIKAPIFSDANNINEIFSKIKDVAYEYNKKNIILKIYNDGLILVTNDDYYSESKTNNCNLGLETNITNKMIKLANIILAVINWTSHQNINNQDIRNNIYLHSKEIQPLNILHYTSKDDFVNIEFVSSGDVNCLNNIRQREDMGVFIQNNITSQFYKTEDFYEFGEMLTTNLDYIFDNNLSDIVFMLYRSTLEVKKANFDISILLSFFVIEKMINLMWEDLLEDKELLTKLKDNKDYTVSIKSNVLYMKDIINKEILGRIDDARKKRNDIVHSKLDFNDKYTFIEIFKIVSEVFATACEIFSKYYNIDFHLDMNFTG